MAQGGGLVSISREARAEAERRGQEPGACAARESSFVFGPLTRRWPGQPDREQAPSEGSGTGLSAPCSRADCEWSAEGLRIPGPGAYPIGRACPRWVRLVEAANARPEEGAQATTRAENDPCTS